MPNASDTCRISVLLLLPQSALKDSQSLKSFPLRAGLGAVALVQSCISMGVPKAYLEIFNVLGSRSTKIIFSTNLFFFLGKER